MPLYEAVEYLDAYGEMVNPEKPGKSAVKGETYKVKRGTE